MFGCKLAKTFFIFPKEHGYSLIIIDSFLPHSPTLDLTITGEGGEVGAQKSSTAWYRTAFPKVRLFLRDAINGCN